MYLILQPAVLELLLYLYLSSGDLFLYHADLHLSLGVNHYYLYAIQNSGGKMWNFLQQAQ